MLGLTLFQFVLLTFIAYLMLYALVDRICKCIETTKLTKGYEKFLKLMGNSEKNTTEAAEKTKE